MSPDPDSFEDVMRRWWPYLAGGAGAIVSLAFLDKLTPKGRVVAFFVGLLTAMFLGPALVELMLGKDAIYSNYGAAIIFLVGLSALGSIPILLVRIRKWVGDPLSLLRGLKDEGRPNDPV